MRATRYFLPTLREVPAEAELASHRLLLRGGFIRKLAAGVYIYLPLGWRVIRKIEQIVREETDRIGGVELFMPALVPQELLDETGRSGLEILFRLKDRHQRPFTLGFTHEEVITDIVRHTVSSYRQMPLVLYQIQTKFRDEPRPRGGVIRAREFLMYDAYSFDTDYDALERTYQAIRVAYVRMFQRMGLPTIIVEAEAGAIGGGNNEEFMIVAEGGEDKVLQCDTCGYGANAEKCELPDPQLTPPPVEGIPPAEKVATPNARTVEEVTAFLNTTADRLVKTLLMRVDGKPVAALVRGDRELNPYKLQHALDGESVEMMDAESIRQITNAPVGFAGPVGLPPDIPILADYELRGLQDFVTGANEADAHLIHVCWGRDFPEPRWADLRVAEAGDKCPRCPNGTLREVRGIEVGHIFQLGVKYSEAMGALYTDAEGNQKPIIMGCYGLGVSRCLAAVAEVHHDADGICFPITVAPFEVVLILVNPEDATQREVAERLYAEMLQAGIEVLYDDRDERSGVKFKDADLIGIPIQVVVGRAVQEGAVEVRLRTDKTPHRVAAEQAVAHLQALIAELKRQYEPTV
ncbi:prolyl-tRNA synthetase [Armatimonadetes bacterium GBS]|jgi:prolyl-tRNA synthetase|nr:MAG: proline--tRNA ligase [Fimbriimonadales bacterium]CUU10956.1 prolyl-tRNA synthetase [Armatimonadetes bacterium GBS]CUU37245.1 prolyl-tRNA synthetase [Armatimonadetes bacterium GXS]